ncbi:hypothetical protein IAQ61_007664 [Plenodomus lingam]|uniref:uncharacterized protein n=1 Tax=Leptosphaeria maculans TaxID=5022 RepID=UPI00332D4C9B|nr:hypothetical protein IAQ61_007664 [Plenodomus lingam]
MLRNLSPTCHSPSSDSRLHVIIYDQDEQVYQVPDFVVPRPLGSSSGTDALLDVSIVEEPFSFAVIRKSNEETLFNTSGSTLIFESQYWRLRTSLPKNPNLYGLGEHTDSLRLPTTDYVRTMWARDAGAVPERTNLYGSHPVYYELRDKGLSHGVLLLNSNGMDIKINDDDGQYLEYNVIGGVIDLYFMAGPGPFDVARQYSEISQKAAMMPYWGFGFHQCRFGYDSVEALADVVANYSKANIPLETMWTGVTAFPDWFHSNVQDYWDYEFATFFDADTGVDIDALWIDMNEPSNFNEYGNDPNLSGNGIADGIVNITEEEDGFKAAPGRMAEHQAPLITTATKVDVRKLAARQARGKKIGLPGRDLINPAYKIKNDFGSLSNKTANTDLIHQGGYAEYDTHNL